ncbi:hypothetical protein D9611_002348 [Ephemerocybe angulata]|uniref:AB hydrolase-1 domain-containing protein n=1 Tax=Ephemerocybe angulata TaxID=980116 RepID=A0A8H5C2I4_9AGAR|nr:hypothetical protein D9611_002348 [Tulosesus angulatus]
MAGSITMIATAVLQLLLLCSFREADAATPHIHTFFYIGHRYTARGNATVATGQMYVEHLKPMTVTQKYPVLIIPGNGMSGTNFLNTPDGRDGWADFFLAKGFQIYIVDPPSRGRSPWHNDIDGPQTIFDAQRIERRFTATRFHKLWPQASLHTQWPGNGSMGDKTFDEFYASVSPSSLSVIQMAQKVKYAGSLLLDKIGPAILMTHSHAGQYGWILADSRPEQVKAIIALEPLGPPFVDAVFPPFAATRPFGLTDIAVEYDPPISVPAELGKVIASVHLFHVCYRQADPPRRLKNLIGIPVLILTSEAGYHALYDDCTADFLRQAGVGVDHIRLEEAGFHGNGHMFFMEKNNLAIAAGVVLPWMAQRDLAIFSSSPPLSMRGNEGGIPDTISHRDDL